MRRITKPCVPRDKECVFTEGINYFETSKDSIWGGCDEQTLEALDKTKIRGKWLNLAAGDGRYNSILLRKADSVVASDIDEGALSKLWHTTPKRLRGKLGISVFDVTTRFPFDDESFDGVFCTGFLHLFPTKIFRKVFSEIDRVLRPGGTIIIDFAADVKRISPKGKLIRFGDEPLYSLKQAEGLLREVFKDYEVRMQAAEVPEEEVTQVTEPHKFSCTFVLVVANKRRARKGIKRNDG